MTGRRPRRAPSSGTWAAISAESRADLYASEHADEVLLGIAAAEPTRRTAVTRGSLERAHVAGAEREAELRARLAGLEAEAQDLREQLATRGEPVTTLRTSDPPRVDAAARAEEYSEDAADALLDAWGRADGPRERRRAVLDGVREAHRAGAQVETDLHTAIETTTGLIARLRSRLRESRAPR